MFEKIPNDPISQKIFGATLGAIAHIIYSNPKSLKDTLARFVFAEIAGATLYFVPIEFFGWAIDPERRVAGALLMAFGAGYVAGPIIRWMVAKTKA